MQNPRLNSYVSRRVFALLLCVMMAFTPAFIARVGMPISATNWDSKVEQLTGQQKENKKELDAINKKLNAAKAELASKEKLRELQLEEIKALEEKMILLEQLMEAYALQVEEKEAQMQELTETMRVGFETFCKRLIFMHESGGEGYLDFLFNSGNFSDFLSRSEIMNDFLAYDTELINGLSENYRYLQTMKEELELLIREGQQTHEEYEAETVVLHAKVAVYNEEVADYESALEKLREEQQKVKEEGEKINSDLEYAEQKAEEEKNKNQSSGGGSTGDQSAGYWGPKYIGKRFPCPIPDWSYVKSRPFFSPYTHGGVDLATYHKYNDQNIPICAAESGVVVASYNNGAWGQMVKIYHGDLDIGKEVYTLYAHMKDGSRKVKTGDTVTKGQVLGYVGNTGRSTGPHLHFELYIGGSTTNYRCNPEAY